MLIIGIDDSGRGPLIGPMILAGVLVESPAEKLFKENGVKDSKQLLHPKRLKLVELIKANSKDYYVAKVSAEEIDRLILSGTNLNTIEAIKAAEIINKLNIEKEKIKVILDCPSTNKKAWELKLLDYVKHPDNLEIVCEHKADINYPAVSAASILAKVSREEEVAKLKKEFNKYGNIGSGYPADPDTKEFLKKNGAKLANSGLFRKTWATWKRIFPEKSQSTLNNF